MKLHIYEHCPFCIRARMIFGVKACPVTLSVIMEGDTETPTRMVGKKVVPILEKDDGSYMPESMGIVHYIDGLQGNTVASGQVDPMIEEWAKRASPAIFKLAVPRFTESDFAELATPEARAAFTQRETKAFGDLAALRSQTPELIGQLLPLLDEAEPYLTQFTAISTTDFILFPLLNSLTIVKDFPFSSTCQAYLTRISSLAGVPLFTAKAR